MAETQVAKRYAKVLINTVDLSVVPSVIEELRAFARLMDSDRRLRLLFGSHIFSEEEKERALKEVLSYMKAKEETGRLLNLIITQGVLHALKDIITSAISLYEEKMKRVTAEVISPVPLKAEHIETLRSALGVLTNRDVQIDNRLDPSLIGGFIVKVGSTIYDSSLKGQLMLLRAELTK
jgi:ATP synthase F1 delta subunit